MTAGPVPALDRLAAGVVARAAVQLGVAATAAERDDAFRLRYEVVVAEGWRSPAELPDGRELDEFDARAVVVLAREPGGGRAVGTTRLVPPGPQGLPTELACDLVVEPRGLVADVGRIAVAPSHRDHRQRVLLPLLAFTYLQLRGLGLAVACGMMTPSLRALIRLLGFPVEVLGPDRPYWHELRAPVRFEAARAAALLP